MAGPAGALRVALVNDMPNAAFTNTERQLRSLLHLDQRPVEVDLYSLRTSFDSRTSSHLVSAGYRPLAQLWDRPPDAIVVTGAEPHAGPLTDEPTWAPLTELLRAAVGRNVALLLSCLSAHMALFALDGIDRVRLAQKRSGVYDHRPERTSPIAAGLPANLPIPHSRWHGVPDDAMRAAGWQIVLASAAGWGAAVGSHHGSCMALVQSHPEYDGATLVREWRRDLERLAAGHRPDVAPAPHHAVRRSDAAMVAELEARVAHGDLATISEFPFEAVAVRAPRPWRHGASRLVANWLEAASRPLVGVGC